MRQISLAVSLAASSLLVGSLTGCFYSGMGYPMDATGYPTPAVCPVSYPVAQTFEYNGSSIFDAQHAVERFILRNYSNPSLVSVHALAVGTNALVANTSEWEFTYRVATQTAPAASPTPIPTPSASPSFVTASTPVTYKLVHMVYTGEALLLAPEEESDTSATLAAVDTGRVLLLSKAIDTARDIGMGVDAPGLEISLRTTVNGGAVYEIDSSYATRQTMSAKAPVVDNRSYTYTYNYNNGSSNGYGTSVGSYDTWSNGWVDTLPVDSTYGSTTKSGTPSSTRGSSYATPAPKTTFVRGKYVIDAYTGAIISRPGAL